MPRVEFQSFDIVEGCLRLRHVALEASSWSKSGQFGISHWIARLVDFVLGLLYKRKGTNYAASLWTLVCVQPLRMELDVQAALDGCSTTFSCYPLAQSFLGPIAGRDLVSCLALQVFNENSSSHLLLHTVLIGDDCVHSNLTDAQIN